MRLRRRLRELKDTGILPALCVFALFIACEVTGNKWLGAAAVAAWIGLCWPVCRPRRRPPLPQRHPAALAQELRDLETSWDLPCADTIPEREQLP